MKTREDNRMVKLDFFSFSFSFLFILFSKLPFLDI